MDERRKRSGSPYYSNAVATDYSGNARTNQYQLVVTNTAGAFTLQYDANGNLTNDGNGLVYEYDAADRTTAIIRNTTDRTEFAYDGLGRRVQVIEKQNGTALSTNKYVWCGTELCEERNNTGATVTKRFFGQGEQISGANYYFTRDHLGSVREMTDTSGAVRARYDYDPYGRRTKVTGDLGADFGYTGHFLLTSQLDHTITLYRFYRPDLGRWNSRDPIEEHGGLNLYAYVVNDPLNLYDPYGLHWTDYIPDFLTESSTVNFVAGMGDNFSFGLTRMIRDTYDDFYGGVNKCSGSYSAGDKMATAISLSVGIGRAAYVGLAKAGSVYYSLKGATAANALAANTFRNGLKYAFNAGVKWFASPKSAAAMATKYGDDWAKWIAAAGRTATETKIFKIPGAFNMIGAYFLGNGIVNKWIDPNDCK